MRRDAEHLAQRAVVRWCHYQSVASPYHAAKRILAIPNGGWRAKSTAQRLKDEGVRSGVPDLFLPVVRRSVGGTWSAGLWIEMKASGGRPSAEQRAEVEQLNADGYLAVVCYGSSQAITTIQKYLT